ncbi:MAG: hypothetical protein J6Y21_01405, partial [Clostridia bacterium]|nr:hypothetical protein [Clostridia bacterium]
MVRRILTVILAIFILTLAFTFCASAEGGSTPEFTQEEFMEILRDAENAAVLYTRPESATRTDVSRFISANFIDPMGKRYGDGKGSRVKGGLSRPGAFMTFLHQY